LRGDEITSQQKYVSARTAGIGRQPKLASVYQRFESALQVLQVGWRFFINDYDIRRKLFHPPVFLRAQQLPDQANVVFIIDARKDDREIARNPLGPQR